MHDLTKIPLRPLVGYDFGLREVMRISQQIDETVRAVTYTRVSSKEQDRDGFSIPAQEKLLRNYASELGISIAREFTDVETAKRSGRPGFAAMVAYLQKNARVRSILVEKTDRLYRNFKDYVTLDDLSVDIHFVKENSVISQDSRSSEKFIHGIKVLMAKNYIDNLSEETRKGMLEKAEQGLWPSCAPIGYKNVAGPDGKRIIEPDPNVAPLVTRLFELYSTEAYSIKEVARVLADEGLSLRASGVMATATVHKILRNRIYVGEFEWRHRIYAGSHVPIVDRDVWERVQQALDTRGTKRLKGTSDGFPFSGLIRCGHCGCALVGELKKAKYVYYHCTGSKGKCPEPYARQEVLEKKFTGLIRKIVMDQEVLAWVTSALRQSHVDERRIHQEAVSRLRAEYQRLQNRLDAMYEDRLDGRIDVALFDRKASEWRAQQTRLLQTIEHHQHANQSYMEEGVKLLDLSRRAGALFERQSAREKRRLLDFVLAGCSWKEGRLEGRFRKPFDLLISATTGAEERMSAVPQPSVDQHSNSPTERKDRMIGQSNHRKEDWLPGMDSNHKLAVSFRIIQLQRFQSPTTPKTPENPCSVQHRYSFRLGGPTSVQERPRRNQCSPMIESML